MQMTAKPDSDRFQSGADKYAAYLETLLDSSSAMLDIARRAAREADVDGRIALNHGDAAQVTSLISRREEYERIFELERKLGSRLEFAAVARYIQVIARHSCASSSKETGP